MVPLCWKLLLGFVTFLWETGSRAHILGHIHHCPFKRLYYTFLDHWLTIMIFDALNLVVPLLKWHLSLTWHSFATAGGCMQLTKCNLLMEILHELIQFLVCEVVKLCLEAMQSAPTWVRVTSRWMRVTLPPEGGDHGLDGSPPLQ